MRSRRFLLFRGFALAFESPETLPGGSLYASGDKPPRRPETAIEERGPPDRCTENRWRRPIERRVFSDAGDANFLIAAWTTNLRGSCQQAIRNALDRELGFDTGQRIEVSAFSQGKGAITLHAPGLSGRLPKITDKIGVLKPLTGPHGEQGTIFWVNNIMLYKQSKHPAEAKIFLQWWSEHEKDLWTKGHVTQLPVRKSFAADPYLQNNPETAFILSNYVPIGKNTATHAAEIFPKLNDVEGEGVMQTLVQNLLQGKDVNASVKEAADRLKSIMTD